MSNVSFTNNFESANNVINNTKETRKEWHKKERTLSKLLNLAQRKDMMKETTVLFKEAGLPTNGKLSKTKYLEFVVNFVEIKGEKLPAYVREVVLYERDAEGKCKKDKEGKFIPLKDDKGNVKTTFKLTAIKEGTWTLEKLLKAVAK